MNGMFALMVCRKWLTAYSLPLQSKEAIEWFVYDGGTSRLYSVKQCSRELIIPHIIVPSADNYNQLYMEVLSTFWETFEGLLALNKRFSD